LLKHPGRFIFSVALSAVLIFALVNAFSVNDEKRIKRALYAAILGIEKNDASRYSRVLSLRYKDDSGLGKAEVLALAEKAFRDFKPFKMELKRLIIKPQGDSAESEIAFRCLFRKEGDEKIYYDAGKVMASWRREEGGWKIVKMQYTGSTDMLFLPAVA